jgi:hypothetical protein
MSIVLLYKEPAPNSSLMRNSHIFSLETATQVHKLFCGIFFGDKRKLKDFLAFFGPQKKELSLHSSS